MMTTCFVYANQETSVAYCFTVEEIKQEGNLRDKISQLIFYNPRYPHPAAEAALQMKAELRAVPSLPELEQLHAKFTGRSGPWYSELCFEYEPELETPWESYEKNGCEYPVNA